MVYLSHPMAPSSEADASTSSTDAEIRSSQSMSRPASTNVGAIVPRAADAVVLEPVADLVLAVGRFERGEFLRLGLGDLLGDLVLDADQDAQRLGGELAVRQHRQLVPHLRRPSRRSARRARGRRRRVVELVGQAGGDGAQRQQLLPLADDLALPPAADHVPSSRCTAIGNSDCMNAANASASSTKNRDGLVTRTDAS